MGDHDLSHRRVDHILSDISDGHFHISLTGWPLTSNDSEQLARGIAASKTVTRIAINCCSFTDLGMQLLSQNALLESIYLCVNSITDVGATALASALAVSTRLRLIDLDYNRISDEGATALASALATNKGLVRLYLSQNLITDVGVLALAEALATNGELEELTLRRNQISNVGAVALAGALSTNGRLETLSIAGNAITDVGAAALAESLTSNTALKELYLTNTQITDVGVLAFVGALASNTTVRDIDISLDFYSPSSEALDIALRRNQEISDALRQVHKSVRPLAAALVLPHYWSTAGESGVLDWDAGTQLLRALRRCCYRQRNCSEPGDDE